MAACSSREAERSARGRRSTVRSQIQARWRAFDALVAAQSGGNEGISRALAVFDRAAAEFKAVAPQGHQEVCTSRHAFATDSGKTGFPATEERSASTFSEDPVNSARDENSRRAYLRAEQALALGREQLARNRETLRLMAKEVEASKLCLSASYEPDPTEINVDHKLIWAEASLRSLDRGELGCLMSSVDMTRAMSGLLRMHQSEFEMQETVICSVGYSTAGELLNVYKAALDLRPFIDDRFLEQVTEIRQLSENLERAPDSDSSKKVASVV